SELKKQLEARTRDLVRGHLSEALEQQTATSEVLRAITSSPGDLKPVFEAILTNARRLCEAKFGHLLIYDGEHFRVAAVHAAPSILTDFLNRGPCSAGPATGLGRLASTKRVVHVADLKAEQAYPIAIRCASRQWTEPGLGRVWRCQCSRKISWSAPS